MSAEDPIRSTLELSSGAQFHRCALQVNPQNYAERYRGLAPDYDEEGYAEALVDRAVELDIDVLGVTDHNHVGITSLSASFIFEHYQPRLTGGTGTDSQYRVHFHLG